MQSGQSFVGQDRVIIDVMAHLQMSHSLPEVCQYAKPQRFL
jgi:hypothetical protein